MEVFHTFTDLVHDIPVVQIFEDFLTDGVVKIGLHEFEYEVQIFIVVGADDVE